MIYPHTSPRTARVEEDYLLCGTILPDFFSTPHPKDKGSITYSNSTREMKRLLLMMMMMMMMMLIKHIMYTAARKLLQF